MKAITTFFSVIILTSFVYGQAVDARTFYKNLEILNRYQIKGEGSISTVDGVATYKIDGKSVDKKTFFKYFIPSEKLSECCPCIMKDYDLKENLIRRSIRCGECVVGWWIEYYPNGKIKVKGKYLDNPSNSWENIWGENFCNKKNGEWIYYNIDGEKSYSEFWANGVFIDQIPVQDSVEVLSVIILLDGEELGNKEIEMDRVKDLNIIATYKNKNHDPILKIQTIIAIAGYKYSVNDSLFESFKDVNTSSLFDEIGVPPNKREFMSFNVLIGDRIIRHFAINLVH